MPRAEGIEGDLDELCRGDDENTPSSEEDEREVDSGDEESFAVIAQEADREAAASGGIFEAASTQRNALQPDDPNVIQSLRWAWRQRVAHNPRLPPISIIFEAVDGRSARDTEVGHPPLPPSYEAWSIVRRSIGSLTFNAPRERLPMDTSPRSINGIPLTASDLKTLDAARILSTSVIAAYGQLLLQDHNSCPVLEGEHRPKVWLAPPCSAHLSPDLLVNLFTTVSRYFFHISKRLLHTRVNQARKPRNKKRGSLWIRSLDSPFICRTTRPLASGCHNTSSRRRREAHYNSVHRFSAACLREHGRPREFLGISGTCHTSPLNGPFTHSTTRYYDGFTYSLDQ